jgi:diphthamide synthase subunit DPH2
MADIRPQRVTAKAAGFSKRKLYARVAYHYPRYSLKEVQQLPYRDVKLLLETAQEEQAGLMHNLTLIAQAPHSKKQSNVKKLLEHFKKLAGKNG